MEDTIAAISTAHGAGGIGIVRISGDKAFDIAGRIFKGRKKLESIKSHTINYGKIIEPASNCIVDEVLLVKMKKPNTFTREDVIEIHCHGGSVILGSILGLVVGEGARTAEPGEFTKRAFLNGRIDLSQAEAVIDLINSKTNESSKAALDQLEGKLSVKLKDLRDKLVDLIAHIEVTVDFPEHDIEEITGEKVYSGLNDIKDSLEEMLKSFTKGRVIREGISVVIVGRPNVGKSSLLNELAGKNRAIVTDIPGTTRDIIEEYINIEGIPVKLIDTAGIRHTSDIVEKIGVEKAEKAVENADLVIMMLDASEGLKDEDIAIIEKLNNKKVIYMVNKMDKVNNLPDIPLLSGEKVIGTSIKDVLGLKELEDEITGTYLKGEISTGNEILLTNIRHKALVERTVVDIDNAIAAYEGGMPLDCITIDIKNAAEALGQITGESVSDEVIHKIFSSFCIGK